MSLDFLETGNINRCFIVTDPLEGCVDLAGIQLLEIIEDEILQAELLDVHPQEIPLSFCLYVYSEEVSEYS
ncbi:MAG: hypothetical protein WC083_05175 [Candidatus Methanomethylophilaceae archaeon]